MANVPKLTVGRVGALAPESKDYVLYEEATPGFGVRVYPSGQRRYVFRYRAGGSRAAPTRMFTIGDARKVGIDDARRVARELAGRVARGEDPSVTKRQAETARARSRRFGEVRDQFLREYVDARLRPSTAAEYRRVLEREFKPLDSRPFSEVSRSDISGVLHKISSRGKLRTSNLARAYARKMFSWARSFGLCDINPVSDTARAGPDVRRERVLTVSELGEIYLSASKSGDVFGDIVRFLMLTGQRRGEVLGATIEEIDFEGRIWRLPAARTKNNREHVVPLSLTCIDIIRSRPRYGRILFSTSSGTQFGAVDKAKKRLDKMILDRRMLEKASAKPMPHWTLHDLRRSFVTHCHGELGITLPVLERAINHVSGSFGGVVGIYNRAQLLPERVAAFEAWEGFVLRSADCVTGRVEPVKGDGRHA